MGGRGAKAKAEEARSIANLLDAGPRKFRGKNFASASRMHIRGGGGHVSGGREEKSSKFPSKILSLQAYKSSFVDKRSKTRTHRVSVVRSSPPHFPSLPPPPSRYLSCTFLADIYRVTTLFTTHASLSTLVLAIREPDVITKIESRVTGIERSSPPLEERPVKELLHPRGGFVINLVGTASRNQHRQRDSVNGGKGGLELFKSEERARGEKKREKGEGRERESWFSSCLIDARQMHTCFYRVL